MTELQKLFFESKLQLQIFFVVLNKPKGIIRNKIAKQLQKPRTTIFDNLEKLLKRTFLAGPELNIEIPYIKKYTVKLTPGKGRTCVLFYVPKLLRNTFIEIYMPETEILGETNG